MLIEVGALEESTVLTIDSNDVTAEASARNALAVVRGDTRGCDTYNVTRQGCGA